jgi:adenine deaminase
VARGDAPADLVLRNAQLVNVYSGEIYPTDVATYNSRIVGLGPGYEGKKEIDLAGGYLAPGLIDAHVHIESSMVGVRQYAQAVVPRGVTSVITDPHEITNVLGLDGIRYMFDQAKYGQLSMFVMVPSCVPATHMATAGAYLEAKDIAALQNDRWVLGLAEMMNYHGVVDEDPDTLEKIEAFKTRVLDGHAPALTGKALNAYVAAGIGSDHECTTLDEAREKLRLGMYILIRDATNAHNLRELLPVVGVENARRICFCTDDRHPGDLLDLGGVDHLVRAAIRAGLDLVTAIRMATLNTAEWFRLYDRGGIRPGNRADLIVFDDPQELRVRLVLRNGQVVAQEGKLLPFELPERPSYLRGSMNVNWHTVDFTIPVEGKRAHVIGAMPDSLITEDRVLEIPAVSGFAVPDLEQDVIKMAVIERHMASGRIGKGFIQGLGLRRGAIASTIAHDHHNLVVAGTDNISLTTAAAAVADMGGGLAVADGIHILARLPLPVAGLMSNKPITEVRRKLDDVTAAARGIGSELRDPFMALSFLALEVIPHLKLTDQGLVDVDQFKIVPLWVE